MPNSTKRPTENKPNQISKLAANELHHLQQKSFCDQNEEIQLLAAY